MTRAAEPSTPESSAATSTTPQPSSQTASRPPRLALLIATGFGLGYVPKMPGTAGSLAGVFLVALAWFFPILAVFFSAGFGFSTDTGDPFGLLYAMLVVVSVAMGLPSCSLAAAYLSAEDPQIVVVDEISGQLITFAPLVTMGWGSLYFEFQGNWLLGWKYLLAGFILFRVFDIWKPWPVRAAEKLPGGWGIMADDWVAGIYAALCLWGLRAAGL